MLKKLFLLLCLSSAFQFFSQNKPGYNLLWKIEGNGLSNPSYLFGTMHVRDARAFEFSDSVMIALDQCKNFALEIHPDTMVMDMFNGLFNEDGEKTGERMKDLLTKEEYRKLDEKFISEYGYSIDKLRIKNPFVIRTMLNRSRTKGTDKSTFVDAYLLSVAKSRDKQICGLEKTKDQLDFFNAISNEEFKEELRQVIYSDQEKNSEKLEKLIGVYSKGNVSGIMKEISFDHTTDSVMIKRNRVMANSMDRIMKTGSLFTAVGVAHLPGDEGVVQLLRNKGYKVQEVGSTFTGVAKKYEPINTKLNWKRFSDTTNGFSIESPGPFMDLKLVPGLEMKFCFDLTNMLSYGYYVVNMSNSEKGLNEKQIIDNIIKVYKSNESNKVEKIRHFNVGEVSVQELLIRTGSASRLRLRLFIQNEILYGLCVGGDGSKLKNPESEKYFDSFVSSPPRRKKDPEWTVMNEEDGAFSLAFPLKPKNMDKEVPLENDPESSFKLKMYMSTDMRTMTNYLVRYNDYPARMYIDKKEKVFNALIDDMAAKYSLISGPDTIWKDGYEGRKFTFKIQDKYYTECRIFLRGNRTYMLLKQNLVPDAMQLHEDNYFHSFTFEPYKKTSLFQLKDEKGVYEVNLPVEPKIVKDSVNAYTSSTENTIDFYATNPSSGGLYQFEASDLGEYFRIKNKSEFYAKFIKNILGYTDSLNSSDSIMIDGHYGREYVVSKNANDAPKRIRLWLAGGKLFYMASYSGRDELFSEQSNEIFNSFRLKRIANNHDLYAPKTGLIMKNLLSKDTAIYNKALGAFDYYFFDQPDLDLLRKGLDARYPDDTLETGARVNIINAIVETKDPAAFLTLRQQFLSEENTDFVRLAAVNAIPEIDAGKGLPLYLELMQQGKEMKTSNYKLLFPLRDSVKYAREHFDHIMLMADKPFYRKAVLQVAQNISKEDSTGVFLGRHITGLTKYYKEDVDQYFKDLADTSQYHDHSELSSYLALLETAKDANLSNVFTKQLLSNSAIAEYYRGSALALRIRQKLGVDKKLIDANISDIKTRYYILKAHDDIGELGKISAKYTTNEELGKMFLHDYITEESDYPKEIRLLGKVNQGEKIFNAYAFTFAGDETEYIGVSGPFTKTGKSTFSELYGYTSYEEKAKDWKEQAMNMLGSD
jgi:uncharacterized protein YbaP (TraB family)